MAELFDIEFVTSHFGSCDLGHYLSLLQKAPSGDLRVFRRRVRAHSKGSRTGRAFENAPGLTCHAAIVAAIDHELRKRNPVRLKLWSTVLPVRQFLVAKFSGLELEANHFFGALYTAPSRRRSFWHMPHNEMAVVVGRFLSEHQKAIVAAILGVISAALIKWLAL